MNYGTPHNTEHGDQPRLSEIMQKAKSLHSTINVLPLIDTGDTAAYLAHDMLKGLSTLTGVEPSNMAFGTNTITCGQTTFTVSTNRNRAAGVLPETPSVDPIARTVTFG